MTPLLTEAERNTVNAGLIALERISANTSDNYREGAQVGLDAITLLTRLLSARAVPMETVGYDVVGSNVFQDRLVRSKFHADELVALWRYAARSEPLVLRSAAEAYTATMRDALQEILECGSIREAERIAARALTDTTTEEEV